MLRNIYAGVRRSTNMVQMNGRRQFVAASSASKPTKPVQEELSYTEKQEKTGRPLSPHVSVYVQAGTFPTIAISSILNRATGVSLSMGLAGCGALSLIGVDVPTMMYEFGHGGVLRMEEFEARRGLEYGGVWRMEEFEARRGLDYGGVWRMEEFEAWKVLEDGGVWRIWSLKE